MLYQLLFFNSLSFALNLFGAFVFFATGLLYFDSWQIVKDKKTPLIRAIGFFLLAFTYAYFAASQKIEIISSFLKKYLYLTMTLFLS